MHDRGYVVCCMLDTVLLLSYSTSSGALESHADLLLSYFIITLSLHNTFIAQHIAPY